MSQSLWIRNGDQTNGPYTSSQFRQLAASGQIKPDHEVSDDQKRWVPAQRVKGLEFESSSPAVEHAANGEMAEATGNPHSAPANRVEWLPRMAPRSAARVALFGSSLWLGTEVLHLVAEVIPKFQRTLYFGFGSLLLRLLDVAVTSAFVAYFVMLRAPTPPRADRRSPLSRVGQEATPSACYEEPAVLTPNAYGGVRRLAYWLGSIALGIVQFFAILVAANQRDPAVLVLGCMLTSLPALALVAARLRNTGTNPWWSILALVPPLNFVVGVRCAICPEGYADTKRLDTAGRILAGVIIIPASVIMVGGLVSMWIR